jgi:hypothetical protein
MGKLTEQTILKEIQKANKYMKKCIKNNKCWQECRGKRDLYPLFTVDGNVN